MWLGPTIMLVSIIIPSRHCEKGFKGAKGYGSLLHVEAMDNLEMDLLFLVGINGLESVAFSLLDLTMEYSGKSQPKTKSQ